MQDIQLYYEKIESALTSSGFLDEEINSSYFKAAFTRRVFPTSSVFLIKEVNDKNFDASSMKNIVELGRQWCAKNLKAMFFLKNRD